MENVTNNYSSSIYREPGTNLARFARGHVILIQLAQVTHVHRTLGVHLNLHVEWLGSAVFANILVNWVNFADVDPRNQILL
jgi:hypothetical protein